MLGPSPDDRAIGQPEPAALRLFLRHLQAFLAPEPFYPLVVHAPAFALEQAGDAAVAVAPEARGQRHDPREQRPLVGRLLGDVALGGACLPHDATGAPL